MLASIFVTPVLASTFASPFAPGSRSVPLRSIFVEPPPTFYPIALLDLVTTAEAGGCCWLCAVRAAADTQSAVRPNNVLLIVFLLETTVLSPDFMIPNSETQGPVGCRGASGTGFHHGIIPAFESGQGTRALLFDGCRPVSLDRLQHLQQRGIDCTEARADATGFPGAAY